MPVSRLLRFAWSPSVRCWGQFGIDLSNCNSWVLSRNNAFQQFIPVIPIFNCTLEFPGNILKIIKAQVLPKLIRLDPILGVGPTPVFLRTPGLGYEMAQSLPQSLPAIIWFTIVLPPPSRSTFCYGVCILPLIVMPSCVYIRPPFHMLYGHSI